MSEMTEAGHESAEGQNISPRLGIWEVTISQRQTPNCKSKRLVPFLPLLQNGLDALSPVPFELQIAAGQT